MIDLQVQIGRTNTSNYAAELLGRTLQAWEDVQEFFAGGRQMPLLLDRAPEHWYEIAVDASPMIEHLNGAILKEERASTGDARTTEAVEPSIRLHLTPRAAGKGDEIPFGVVGRFLQQLFLAMNIGTPGSCNLKPCIYPDFPYQRAPILNADILDDALFDALEEGWPLLRWIPFEESWEWLHHDMAYDIDLAREPTQKAFFGILRICSREQWDPDNLIVLTQAFEGLMKSVKGRLRRELEGRMEMVLGKSSAHPHWFEQFYRTRSRIVHGDLPVLRPGEMPLPTRDREAHQLSEEAAFLEGKAVAALLALLQDMVIHNVRAYRFEQQLVRVQW